MGEYYANVMMKPLSLKIILLFLFLVLVISFISLNSVQASSECCSCVVGVSVCPCSQCHSFDCSCLSCPHHHKDCYQGDVYWYDSCSNREEIAEYCGDSYWTHNYQCSGNVLQRQWIERGCRNFACFENSQWRTYQNCSARGRICQNNQCLSPPPECRDYDYLACYNNDVYWFDSWGYRQSKYQECGEDYYSSWGSDYCYNNDVYRKRTCYQKGCRGGSCYSDSYRDTQLVEDCGPGQTCRRGECIDLFVCSSGPCCEDGYYKPSTAICDVDIETEYGCPWSSACGADVGKRTKSRFRYCSGSSSQCTGKWGQWKSWTNWMISDYCSANETCLVGSSKCQHSSACIQPTSSYIKYYRKDCYDDDIYWFDINGARQDKYKECSDDNSCTLDGCRDGACFSDSACDETACEVGSSDYCQNCEHCGDENCNCEENMCTCFEDCRDPEIIAAILGEKESAPPPEEEGNAWLAAIGLRISELFKGGNLLIVLLFLFILLFSVWYLFYRPKKQEAV